MVDINTLLRESLQPEQANLVEQAIAQAIKTKLEESAKDVATEQAKLAQASQEQIDNLTVHFENELKKAAEKVIELEKFYNDQSKIAVDKVLQAHDENDRLNIELTEAKEQGKLGEVDTLREQIAQYITEKAALKEGANKYAEYVRTETLAEMQSMVEEAKQQYITENQDKFNELDKLSRYESTLNTIKESFEKIGIGLSEDLAYQGLEEEIDKKDAEIAQLQEQLRESKGEIFKAQKEKVFVKLTESASELQKEKFKNLSEAITATDIDSYEKTLGYLVESISNTSNVDNTKKTTVLNESIVNTQHATNDKDLVAKQLMNLIK